MGTLHYIYSCITGPCWAVWLRLAQWRGHAGQSGVIRNAVVFGPSLGTTHAVVNGTRYLSSYLDHPGWFLASMALLMAWVA
jgi:hypothetical protein